MFKFIKECWLFLLGFIIGISSVGYSIYFTIKNGGLFYSQLMMWKMFPKEYILMTLFILLGMSLMYLDGNIKKG